MMVIYLYILIFMNHIMQKFLWMKFSDVKILEIILCGVIQDLQDRQIFFQENMMIFCIIQKQIIINIISNI